MTSLIEINNATKIYRSRSLVGKQKSVTALRNFNLTIEDKPAKILTIAGESGSGKTTLANGILGFLSLTSGNIRFKGEDISRLNHAERKAFRHQVQAIFQDPYEVYNPFYKVRHVFDLILHNFSLAKDQKEGRNMVEEALNIVGLRGDEVIDKYPHQLSGGQRQRIMMARACLLKPALIVADEPVSMVDASLRALILDTMLKLRDSHNISFLYITHDLSTAYQIDDSIIILYQGLAVERGLTRHVIETPCHPYVKLLIESVPVPDPKYRWKDEATMANESEDQSHLEKGCPFYSRCPQRLAICVEEVPQMKKLGGVDHEVACHLFN